ncbi:MAG: peptidoglycan DD-metalloendopeptidase family protein [Pseudomonadota bacterium]
MAATNQQEAEQKLSKVQEQIRSSQKKLEKQRGELGNIEKQLREAEENIGQLNKKLKATEASLKRSQEKIAALQGEEIKLQNALAKHQRILYAQIRSEYRYGGQQKLKLMLNQEQPEKLGRDLIYYDYVHRARLSEMDRATQILQSVNQVQTEIMQAEQLYLAMQKNLLNEKIAIEKAQKKRKTAIDAINNSVSTEKQKLADLASDEKQLKDLIEKLRTALADIPVIDQNRGFSKSKGTLYWPVVGKPSNKFGQKRTTARSKHKWHGVFIPSGEGNNVRSIYHGRVAFAEWMRGLGLLVIVDHGGGYMSLYGHNQSLFKQVGEWVDAGEILANVGNSGGSNKTGLYFEIRKQGSPVNPANWCTKPAASRKITAKKW